MAPRRTSATFVVLLAGALLLALACTGTPTPSGSDADSSSDAGLDTGPDDADRPADGSPDSDSAADARTDGDSDEPADADGVDPAAGPPRLVSASTLSATTIEILFSRSVEGSNLGFSLQGTRSSSFESMTGFGTAALVGTVADEVVYGEVVTLSYDDAVGDIEGLPWYRRERIDNNQPFAGPEVYVAPDATGSGDGSLARPFDVRQINDAANSAPGVRINLQKGVYTERLIVSTSGEPGRPIIYEGYGSTAGDTDYAVFHPTYPTPLDGERMPIFDGGDRDTNGDAAVTINNRRYITFRNIQITNYRMGFTSSFPSPSDHLNFVNCATEDIGDTTSSRQGNGFNITFSSTFVLPSDISVVDSYARNSAMANFTIAGPGAYVHNCRSFSDQDVFPGSGELHMSTDYHFGLKNVDDGVIRQCHAENVGDLEHTAHGISIRSDNGYTSHNVLIDDCDVININGSVELRHDEVRYGLVRNVRITGGSSRYAGGFHFRDGASFNRVDGCVVRGIRQGSNGAVSFYDSVEEGTGQTLEGNVIMNSVFDDVVLLIRLSSSGEPTFETLDNALLNCTVHVVETAYRRYDNLTNTGFVAVNNIFYGVHARDHGSSAMGAEIVETYSDYFDGYATPEGAGNLSLDPMFEDAARGDFHLRGESLVRDAGTDLTAVIHDLDGVPRPSGSYSMGAFE